MEIRAQVKFLNCFCCWSAYEGYPWCCWHPVDSSALHRSLYVGNWWCDVQYADDTFFPPCISETCNCAKKMSVWSSGFHFYVCSHLQQQRVAKRHFHCVISGYVIWKGKGKKRYILLMLVLCALVKFYCNKTTVKPPEPVLGITVLVSTTSILSGLIWVTVLNVVL